MGQIELDVFRISVTCGNIPALFIFEEKIPFEILSESKSYILLYSLTAPNVSLQYGITLLYCKLVCEITRSNIITALT
jgi:hypothetical protein